MLSASCIVTAHWARARNKTLRWASLLHNNNNNWWRRQMTLRWPLRSSDVPNPCYSGRFSPWLRHKWDIDSGTLSFSLEVIVYLGYFHCINPPVVLPCPSFCTSALGWAKEYRNIFPFQFINWNFNWIGHNALEIELEWQEKEFSGWQLEEININSTQYNNKMSWNRNFPSYKTA